MGAAAAPWSTCGRCAPRWRPAGSAELRYRPKRPAAGDRRALRRLDLGHFGGVFFLSVLHALHDSFRKLRSFVFIERISEVTEVFERERDFRTISERISREGGVADVSGYTDYGRVWLEFFDEISRTSTRARP